MDIKQLNIEAEKVLKLRDTLNKTFNNDDKSHLNLAIIGGLKDVWNKGHDEGFQDGYDKGFKHALSTKEWNNDKVIDFVNWYVDLHQLGINYKLENRTILESFKDGDDVSKWLMNNV